MVKVEETTKWKCPYCDKLYDDEDDAEDCASDCVDVESPTEVDEVNYYCEICENNYDEYSLASDCEEKHKEGKDSEYKDYLDNLERQKLVIASQHKEQRKLI